MIHALKPNLHIILQVQQSKFTGALSSMFDTVKSAQYSLKLSLPAFLPWSVREKSY